MFPMEKLSPELVMSGMVHASLLQGGVRRLLILFELGGTSWRA